MKQKIKGFIKDALIYGVGDALGKLTNLLLLPILSRIFTPADYGVVDLLTASYIFLFMTLNFNVLTGFQKFFFLNQEENRKVLVSSTIGCYFVFYAVISILLIGGAKYISCAFFGSDLYVTPIIFLAICMPIEGLYDALTILLRLKRLSVAFSVVNICRLILTILISYCCVVMFEFGISGVFFARLIALFVITSYLLLFLLKEFSLNFSFKMYKRMFLFSIPGHPDIIIKSFMSVLPLLMLKHFSTLTEVGLYGIANRIAQTLTLFINAFQKAWNPFAFEHADKPDEANLYSKVYKLFFAVIVFLGLVLTIFAKEVIEILTPREYHSAYTLVGGLNLYYGLLGLNLIYSTIFYTKNKVKYTSLLTATHLFIFFVMASLWTGRYAAPGLLAALNVSIFINVILYHCFGTHLLKFKVQIGRLALAFGVACGGVVILDHLTVPLVGRIVFKSIYLIVFMGALPITILNSNERKALVEFLKGRFRIESRGVT